MFELAAIRRPLGSDHNIDAGLVAEALLFYGQTHLVLDRSSFQGLVSSIGPSSLIRLLQSPYARATFLRDMEGVKSSRRVHYAMHSFVEFSLSRHASGQWASAETEIRDSLASLNMTEEEIKRFTSAFLELMPQSKLSANFPRGRELSAAFADEVRRNPNLHEQALIVLQSHFGRPPPVNLTKFRLSEMAPNEFFVSTDMNWEAANAELGRVRGGKHNLSAASVLATIWSAYVELAIAGRFGADLLTMPVYEDLIVDRCSPLLSQRRQGSAEILAFARAELGDGHAIREAINSGLRKFDDFLDVLDRAERFKTMLKGANPDVGLIKAYYDEVSKGSWISQLVPKKYRFGFFTGAGALAEAVAPSGLGLLASTAVNAIDSFFLDRVGQGWRPNTFVQGVLKPFVDGRSER